MRHTPWGRYEGFPDRRRQSQEGLHSDAVAFSFYATKSLAIGEGGMVTCHNQDLLERMRVFCLHGIAKDAWNRYGRTAPGTTKWWRPASSTT